MSLTEKRIWLALAFALAAYAVFAFRPPPWRFYSAFPCHVFNARTGEVYRVYRDQGKVFDPRSIESKNSVGGDGDDLQRP